MCLLKATWFLNVFVYDKHMNKEIITYVWIDVRNEPKEIDESYSHKLTKPCSPLNEMYFKEIHVL